MELKPGDVSMIVVHCSATKAHQDVGAYEIDQWHKDRGWGMIGYHSVIRRSGEIEGGRPLNVVGAHAVGHNKNSVAVCLVGGLDPQGKPEDNFTHEQYASLAQIISNWKSTLPNIYDVLGHRDLSPDVDGDGIVEPWEWLKSCPCFDVRSWYGKWEDKA